MSRSFTVRVLSAVICLAIPSLTFAQQKSFEGDYNGAKVPHKVKLEKGKLYTITMVSGDFDTFLYLNGPDGNEVAKDDDGGGGLNSKIVYAPTKAGEFVIEASSFGQGQGKYKITVDVMDGKVFTGNLQNNADTHKIKLDAGKTYTVNMTSGQFDTFLILTDPNGMKVAEDDDGGELLNSRIVYTPTNAGEYTITATAFGNMGTGNYSIIVTEMKKE